MNLLKNTWKFIAGLSTWKKVILVIVIVIFGFFGYRYFSAGKTQQQYQTAAVTKGTLVVSVSESGSVAAANQQPVTTAASGVVSEVDVKNGDTVSQGQVIAKISPDSTSLQKQTSAWEAYLSAQNNLLAAQANLNTLQATLFKTNQAFLQDRGVANPTDQQKADPVYIQENDAWLAAQAGYVNQQNVIAAAQAGVSSAWLSYQQASGNVVAPIAGVITDITVVPGMQIAANTSTTTVSSQTVASIKTQGNPIVSVQLSELDAAKVKAGQSATITFDALPNQTFTGKVFGIDTAGTISSGVTSYPATIVLDTPSDAILPNMSATASIITKVDDNILLVPSGAVQTTNGQSVVHTLQKNGTVATVPVAVGDSSDSQTQITQGVAEGDNVIIGYTAPSSGSSSSSPFSGGLRVGGFGGGNAVFRGTGRGG